MLARDVSPIRTKSVIADELLAIAKADGEWIPYYHFTARPVAFDVLLKDPLLDWIAKRYNFIAGVLKMEPYQQYDWHIDARRGVGINLLLEHDDSIVLFSDKPMMLVKDIRTHKYDLNTYYLFNTQTAHCVINYSKPRYLFSVEFAKDKDELTYDDLWLDITKNYRGTANE